MASYDDTATVSGSVVSIENGADDVPTKSLVVTIPPTLSGVSAVTETQTGRNLLLLTDGTYTIGNTGATATILNGEISVTGTTVNSGGRTARLSDYFILHAGTYYISPVISTSPYVRSYLNKKSDNTVVGYSSGYAFTISEDTEVYYGINLESGKTYNTTLTPQLEYGSTAHAYEPYTTPTTYTASLGRTIYGGTADIVNGVGKDNFASILISETSWTYDSANARFISANLTGMKNVAIRTLHVMAYGYETIDDARPLGNVPGQAIYNANYERKVIIHDSNYTNVSDFLTAKGNISIIYPIATPTDFTFTGQEIPTRPGYNAFWSEQGNTELTYYKSGYGFTSVTVHKETPDGEPVVQTVKFHRIVYGGQADVVRGTCEPKNPLKLYLARTSHQGINFSLTDDGLLHMEGTNTSTTSSAFSGGNYSDYESCPWKFPPGTYTASSLITADTSKVGSVNFLIRTKTDNVNYSYALKDAPKTFTINDDFGAWFWASVLKTETVNCDVGVQLEKGSSASEYAPHFDPFTFPPISMSTDEGENTLFADQGDSSITYRKAVD